MAKDPAEAMLDRLRGDLKAALLARQPDEVRVLRSLMSAIDNAQAVPLGDQPRGYVQKAFGDKSVEVPRRILTGADVQAVLEREAAARETLAETMAQLGRPVDMETLRTEALIVRRYVAASPH
jgi:uncharacterized protein YqeY